jgi:hypothetical protein
MTTETPHPSNARFFLFGILKLTLLPKQIPQIGFWAPCCLFPDQPRFHISRAPNGGGFGRQIKRPRELTEPNPSVERPNRNS